MNECQSQCATRSAATRSVAQFAHATRARRAHKHNSARATEHSPHYVFTLCTALTCVLSRAVFCLEYHVLSKVSMSVHLCAVRSPSASSDGACGGSALPLDLRPSRTWCSSRRMLPSSFTSRGHRTFRAGSSTLRSRLLTARSLSQTASPRTSLARQRTPQRSQMMWSWCLWLFCSVFLQADADDRGFPLRSEGGNYRS